jgi:hypothetical protein
VILIFLDMSLDRTFPCSYINTRCYVLSSDFTGSFGLLATIMHTTLHARGSARHISASIDKRAQSICATEQVRCTGMPECLTLLYVSIVYIIIDSLFPYVCLSVTTAVDPEMTDGVYAQMQSPTPILSCIEQY